MKITVSNLVEGARSAVGLTVIIDVFRAFSLECYAFDKGAETIIPVGNIDEAYALKKEHPEYILVGERQEKMPKGFDYGNSPFQILNADLRGKTIVHTTSAGTQGLVNAVNAEEIITGSFVNAGAIVRYIQQINPLQVSLVGMGYSTKYPIEEDVACAEYIANELKGIKTDFEAIVEHIRSTSGARFFLKEKQDFAPQEDFDLCLNINKFNFVLKAYKQDDQLKIKKINI